MLSQSSFYKLNGFRFPQTSSFSFSLSQEIKRFCMCSFPMSLSHSFTSKPPFFVKQISDMHVRRLNLKPQHVTISASQSGSVFTVSMKHNIAPPNDTSHTTLNVRDFSLISAVFFAFFLGENTLVFLKI